MPRSKGAPEFRLLEDSPVRARLFATAMVDTEVCDFEEFMVKEAILNTKRNAYLLRIPYS